MSSWASAYTWTVLLWMALTPVIRIFGIVGLRLRVDIRRKTQSNEPWTIYGLLVNWINNEIKPCANHAPSNLTWRKDTYPFLVITWFTAVGSVFHLFYGTLVFSSIMCISVEDAVPVAVRYLISAFICRLLLMFELSGLRKTLTVQRMQKVPIIQLADHSTDAMLGEHENVHGHTW